MFRLTTTRTYKCPFRLAQCLRLIRGAKNPHGFQWLDLSFLVINTETSGHRRTHCRINNIRTVTRQHCLGHRAVCINPSFVVDPIFLQQMQGDDPW